jgi:tetratricopeptide (TPR) repeat protein
MNPAVFLEKTWLRMTAFAALLLGIKQRALEAYEQMARLDPKDIVAWATVGSMRMEQGDSTGAVDAFLRLLEVRPDHADSWFNLGYIYEQRNDEAEAERCFRRAVELNPNQDRAWYGLGLVLIRTGRLPEAVEVLKQNIKLQPFSPYGYYQLAMTHHHLGDSGEAWRTYEKLKNFEPRYAATLKRDIEQTRPQMQPGAPSSSDTISTKEAIAATT